MEQRSTFFAPDAHVLQFRENGNTSNKDLGRGRDRAGSVESRRQGPESKCILHSPGDVREREAACNIYFFFLSLEKDQELFFGS